MEKAARPFYTRTGVIFFSGPWAKADYLPDGSIRLYAATDLSHTELIAPEDARGFMQVIGDRRGTPSPR